ncbi:unnamed protein product, partial [Callosobruchus maculatus]
IVRCHCVKVLDRRFGTAALLRALIIDKLKRTSAVKHSVFE